MRSLFIDTTSFFMTVAILEDNLVLFKFQEEVRKDMSSKIIPIIENGFNKVNFTINDIDKIFVVNGPGSFTGIRVGVTVAKTIAWALHKDIITLSSLEFLATTKTDKEYLIPMIDARRENVFCGIYDTNLNVIEQDKLCEKEKLKNYPNEKYEFVSNDDILNSTKPRLDICKIINKHCKDKPLNCHLVNPNYLKLTEAEENIKND